MVKIRAGSLCTPSIALRAWIEGRAGTWEELGIIRIGEYVICMEDPKPNPGFSSFNLVPVLSALGIHYINMSYLQIDVE